MRQTTRSERATNGTQAIASELTDYSKRSFVERREDREKLLGARSLDKAIEVQTEYAKAAYVDYVTSARKLGELYVNLAQEAFSHTRAYCEGNASEAH